MATIRHAAMARRALMLGVLLAAAPAQAQEVKDPAGPRAGRAVTGTGQTKPAGAPVPAKTAAPAVKPMSQGEMAKAQKAAEARSRAWDARTKRSMSSICNGC